MESGPPLGFSYAPSIKTLIIPNTLLHNRRSLPWTPSLLRCCSLKTPPNPKPRHQRRHSLTPKPKPTTTPRRRPNPSHDDGIPADDIKVLVNFKSRHHYIRVLQVSPNADHPFAGSRLLLLDAAGNIHSLSFLFKSFTNTYFDVFATLPPILPPGPLGIFGFGAGSAARLILELYPRVEIHGWELDPSVISVGREFFGLSQIEKLYSDRLFVYIGNALHASVEYGFSGILVDLFGGGCLIPELQDPNTWLSLKKSLRKGGRIMANVGGSCVEPEDSWRDGKEMMAATLTAMDRAFPGQVSILSLGNREDDSSIALTGDLLDLNQWRKFLPEPLMSYADMWKPYKH